MHLLLEALQGLTESFAELRKSTRPEDDQDDHQNNDEL
jgi:hypothetical protein